MFPHERTSVGDCWQVGAMTFLREGLEISPPSDPECPLPLTWHCFKTFCTHSTRASELRITKLSTGASSSSVLLTHLPPGTATGEFNTTVVAYVSDILGSTAVTSIGVDGMPLAIVSIPPDQVRSRNRQTVSCWGLPGNATRWYRPRPTDPMRSIAAEEHRARISRPVSPSCFVSLQTDTSLSHNPCLKTRPLSPVAQPRATILGVGVFAAG